MERLWTRIWMICTWHWVMLWIIVNGGKIIWWIWRDRSSDSDAESWIWIIHFWCWLTQVNLDLRAERVCFLLVPRMVYVFWGRGNVLLHLCIWMALSGTESLGECVQERLSRSPPKYWSYQFAWSHIWPSLTAQNILVVIQDTGIFKRNFFIFPSCDMGTVELYLR